VSIEQVLIYFGKLLDIEYSKDKDHQPKVINNLIEVYLAWDNKSNKSAERRTKFTD
jgi:hypothetical protein